MTTIASPFLSDIKECRLSMRKLRKKIYKHCLSKQRSKKQKDNTEEIIEIFRKRNVPAFVTETLKKRRNFDMSSIKNIIINAALPLEEIRNKVNLQEMQINSLYSEHKERMEEERKLVCHRPLRLGSFNQSNVHSSTNEDDFMGSQQYEDSSSLLEDAQCDFYQDFQQPSKEPMITDNYLHLNESSFNEDLGFLNF